MVQAFCLFVCTPCKHPAQQAHKQFFQSSGKEDYLSMQSKDAIRAINERTNIVDVVRRYVELKRNGPRWVAPCPFHQETKPSFSVNEDQGLFYCFGCHASGDIFDFYSRINGLDFKETLEQLAA